jgi:hypothetical protein
MAAEKGEEYFIFFAIIGSRSFPPIRRRVEGIIPSKIVFQSAVFAVIIVIDSTGRPAVHYRRGKAGKFLGRSGNLYGRRKP